MFNNYIYLMKDAISILIPTYNDVCIKLVKSLQVQASALPELQYEIIVADDGSTDIEVIKLNREINSLPHCKYVEREKNAGRAAIRNFLVRQSQYPWLLFIDSDLSLDNKLFVRNYMLSDGEVVVGGLTIGGNHAVWRDNLRYRYEKACEKAHDYRHRQQKGEKEFRTTNFLISKTVMEECPFNESFTHYGYEDVMLGKDICAHGYEILHIDNPTLLCNYESNLHFVQKTEEACRTLYHFRKELHGYSKLISFQELVRKTPFAYSMIRAAYPCVSMHIKARLTGKDPSVFLYNLYKLLYFTRLDL